MAVESLLQHFFLDNRRSVVTSPSNLLLSPPPPPLSPTHSIVAEERDSEITLEMNNLSAMSDDVSHSIRLL